MKKIKVDVEKCIGCSLCASIAPKSFKMNSDYKSEAINPFGDKEESVRDAIASCPVTAISEE